MEWCAELGVRAVTVYAFSIENFKRSAEEVEALIELCAEKLRGMCHPDHLVMRNRVRVRLVGDMARVRPSLLAEMEVIDSNPHPSPLPSRSKQGSVPLRRAG